MMNTTTTNSQIKNENGLSVNCKYNENNGFSANFGYKDGSNILVKFLMGIIVVAIACLVLMYNQMQLISAKDERKMNDMVTASVSKLGMDISTILMKERMESQEANNKQLCAVVNELKKLVSDKNKEQSDVIAMLKEKQDRLEQNLMVGLKNQEYNMNVTNGNMKWLYAEIKKQCNEEKNKKMFDEEYEERIAKMQKEYEEQIGELTRFQVSSNKKMEEMLESNKELLRINAELIAESKKDMTKNSEESIRLTATQKLQQKRQEQLKEKQARLDALNRNYKNICRDYKNEDNSNEMLNAYNN